MAVVNYFKNAIEFDTYKAGGTIYNVGDRDEVLYYVKA
jgi:hypothetical protein